MFFQTSKKKIPQQAKALQIQETQEQNLGASEGPVSTEIGMGSLRGRGGRQLGERVVLEYLAVRFLNPSQEAWGLLGLGLPQRG